MRDLFTTIGTRYLIAILNLALIFINAKVLGVEGVGLVGLILAIVGIATMFCGILAGNTIVYFMNRYSMQAVFLPSYCWTPAGAGIACGSMAILGVLPEGHTLDIYILSILTSLVAANSRFLLGKNQIFGFNLTFVLQGGLLFFVLLFLYYGLKIRNVTAYLWGMYFTNGIAFLVSLFLLLPFLNKKRGRSPEGTLPIRSFERDVCLRALGKCGQYCRDPDYPPQLFPDPTVCRVGKRRTAGCGNQDFRERLAYQSQHRLYHIQPRCPDT